LNSQSVNGSKSVLIKISLVLGNNDMRQKEHTVQNQVILSSDEAEGMLQSVANYFPHLVSTRFCAINEIKG